MICPSDALRLREKVALDVKADGLVFNPPPRPKSSIRSEVRQIHESNLFSAAIELLRQPGARTLAEELL
jgi:hypothetical protein